MLIVGTKGRSLDGVQGFLVNRSSFSKYCLQYSPVPVVVVRPNEKREKKKAKRAHDPNRQSYVHMLLGQPHEADSENSSVYELEPQLTADEEAHRVAVAVGLPAAYDPTIKPIDPATLLKSYNRRSTPEVSKETLEIVNKGGVPAEKKSPDRESDSDSEGEFETETGEELLRKQRLHNMEVNEGAILRAEARKLSSGSTDSDEDPASGGAKT